MKVLVVHPRLGVMGGGERVAIHTINALLKAGHQVYFLSEHFDTVKFEDFFGCEGLFEKVVSLQYRPFKPVFPFALLYSRLFYHEVNERRALSRNHDLRFDLVISTQDVLYVPQVRAPIIQYCYYPEYFAHLISSPTSKAWGLYYFPASRFYRKKVSSINTLLSVSEFSRSYIKKIWHRASTTLYPPCPTETFKLNSKVEKENIVVTIGRIVPEKRHDVFMQLARALPHAKFVLVGSVAGDKTRYYDHLIRGMPSNATVTLSPLRHNRELLQRAKVYVHCMRDEHFGIAIVEAMAAGLVPVEHDSGGPREIVTEECGFRWTNQADAAGQIGRLLDDDSLREAMSQASIARAQNYSDEVFEIHLSRLIGSQ